MDRIIPFPSSVNGLPAVLSGLESVRQTGDHSWQALCPAHPDRVPSLSVTDTPDRILLYCHAGCAVENVVAAMGLTMPCLFKTHHSAKPNVVATYDYYDRSGHFLYQVVRYDKPKRFLQRRLDGGKWVWNFKGREPVPYRLPELLAAVERGETVYVAEGEKDVDNLVAIGLTATCNSGGACKWTDVHSHYFRPGTNVVILPDNDAPGQKHARKVAELLSQRGAIVKVVGLPGLAEKGDISGWLADGHSKEELLGLAAESSVYQVTTAAAEDGLPAIYAAWQEVMQATRYAIDEAGYLCCKKYNSAGDVEQVPIANFVARPVREIIRDDGRDTVRTFEIEGLLAKGVPLPPVAVPAKDFAGMTWVPGAWGLGAAIEPGRGAADRVRHSIQSLAPGIPRQTVYNHLGWRMIGGRWVYLYADGAVGADDLTVETGEGLHRYTLSATADRTAVADSLRCLGVAPRHVTYPLAALVYLAPLCEPLRTAGIEPAFTMWLFGQSGTLKSTLAALFLSHYGRFAPKNLPGSFKDTENALEKRAFWAKDTVLVVMTSILRRTGSMRGR